MPWRAALTEESGAHRTRRFSTSPEICGKNMESFWNIKVKDGGKILCKESWNRESIGNLM